MDSKEWDARAWRAMPVDKALRKVAADDPNFMGLDAGPNHDLAMIRVFRVGGASDKKMEAKYKALAKADVPVVVENAQVTKQQLDTLQQYVAFSGGDKALWAKGVPFKRIQMETTAEGFENLAGRIEVGISPYTLAAAEIIYEDLGDKFFGRDKIVVVEKEGFIFLSVALRNQMET